MPITNSQIEYLIDHQPLNQTGIYKYNNKVIRIISLYCATVWLPRIAPVPGK